MDLEASNIVKPVRVLLSLLMVAAVLFASTSSVSAIGFDAEKAYESVFVVYSGTSLGSGFAIGENCVITNAHVIADTNNIAIVTYEGTEYAASLLGINEDEDIAVLVIENATFPYLMMANLSAVKTVTIFIRLVLQKEWHIHLPREQFLQKSGLSERSLIFKLMLQLTKVTAVAHC